MATLDTLKLRKIMPSFRHALDDNDKPIVHEGPGRREWRRRASGAPHTRLMQQSNPENSLKPEKVIVHMTQEYPWTKKRRNRAANKAARASRKANR